MSDYECFAKMVIKQTISDFYTPNIKAEVILDTLLTEYIPAILESCLETNGTVKLITKELSIGYATEAKLVPSNRGKKVDYVAADDQHLYLVELKTTQGSLGAEQLKTYMRLISENKRGNYFLDLLCRILLENKPDVANPYSELEDYLRQKLTDRKNEICSREAYEQAKQTKQTRQDPSLPDYAERYQKSKNTKGSCKYIHTVAEIVQNSSPKDWEKEIGIVYISPGEVKADDINDIKSITFRDIANNNSERLKDFKESVLFTEIIKPLFL